LNKLENIIRHVEFILNNRSSKIEGLLKQLPLEEIRENVNYYVSI